MVRERSYRECEILRREIVEKKDDNEILTDEERR